METSPPIKPPRGVKPGKETSGLLMSVIRTLSAIETNEQRDREKIKIETEYKRSDAKLDELISKHEPDLTKVMQLFGTLSTGVDESRRNIRRVKENLKACKVLLHCRRDELKKLWFQGLEYKHMLQLLDEIDEMKQVPSKVANHLAKKHYLHATNLLVNAVSLGKGSLDGVEGIRELNAELEQRKHQLYSKLMEELRTHLYVRPSQEAVNLLQRQHSSFQRNHERRSSANRHQRHYALKKNLFPAGEQQPNENEIEEDVEALDPEADTVHFMAILVKCLALLSHLPKAIEKIELNIQNELLLIVHRTTLQVNDLVAVSIANASATARTHPDGSTANSLVELMQMLFEQFRHIARAHATLLLHVANVSKQTTTATDSPYSVKEFWAKVQIVLQIVLTDYFDIQNLLPESQLGIPFTDTNDVSTYFSRRKFQTKKKSSLFTFNGSSSALAKTDQLNRMKGLKEKVLVCVPDSNNVTLIFVPLMCFIEEIEFATDLKSGKKCNLNVFISEYITEQFLSRHRIRMQSEMDAAVRVPDAWKLTTILMDTARETKPVLQSTVTVERCVEKSKELMYALPLYGEHILRDVCGLLQEYRDTCVAAYSGLVQPHPEDKRVYSAAWLKDDDISRFLKSLPNWINLKSQQLARMRPSNRSQQQHLHLQPHQQRVPLRREHTEEESPEDIRLRNMREAEILVSNFGEGDIHLHEIMSDMSLLRDLAQLQQSIEWFAGRILLLTNELRNTGNAALSTSPSAPQTSALLPPVSSSTLKTLANIGHDFDELADTCLLVLHLEVRVQCFYYLLKQNYNQVTDKVMQVEVDPNVTELCRVLINVDEAMNLCLHQSKCKYIFEGLGHLIAKMLISSSQYMSQMDKTGIQRMCRNVFLLQQTLTNITMTREIALDHAKRYFELFYLSPEEIFNGILEKGPEFSELEYMNAFQLLHRSQTDKKRGSIDADLAKLSDILSDVGITV